MTTFEERIKRVDKAIEEIEILMDIIRDNIKEMNQLAKGE